MEFLSRIASSKKLPSLPQILLNLIEVCSREDSTIEEISQIINSDPPLSAKVMGMVNSVYYSLSSKVTTIEHAIVLLGTDAVKNIAISSSIYQVFGKVGGNSAFKMKLFWWHSLMCATMAKLIAEKVRDAHTDEAFLSGLLHDVGKLTLWIHFPEEYTDILRSSEGRPDLLLEGEKRLGGTHCEVGAWMINQWKLQSSMAEAVLYHHEKVNKIMEASPLAKVIFVANVLSSETLEENAGYKVAKEVWGFTPSEVDEMLSQAREGVRQTAQLMEIEIESPDISDKDREKQEELAREVKDMALLQGTLQSLIEVYEEDSILKVIQQGLQVLFNVNRALFFLYDPKRDVLVGKGGMGLDRDVVLNELVIPLQDEVNLPVKSLCQRTPLDSFGHPQKTELTATDRKIISLIEKEGMICLPMAAHKKFIGVIVLGADETEVSDLQEQMKLLTMLANQTALALHVNNLRETQTELIQAERLSASSAMAQRVSHEVNNPLGIIKNYLGILGRKLDKDDPAQTDLKIINEEVDRVSFIVSELSDFSEPKVQKKEPVNINRILSDIIKITRDFLLKSRIEINLDLDSQLPMVIADGNRMKQVFINLVKNGVEAMPQGGNLSIETRCDKSALGDMKEGLEYVEIVLSDDGQGIPDAIKPRLFEPYVSSKGSGHAGLGLSIVYGIVRELNGTITCESDRESGTSFKIFLPVG